MVFVLLTTLYNAVQKFDSPIEAVDELEISELVTGVGVDVESQYSPVIGCCFQWLLELFMLRTIV